jgi:hypothetical protein
MPTYEWTGSQYPAETPGLSGQYNMAQIDTGMTLTRTLLWVEGTVEFTSPDPFSGTDVNCGLVVGPSNVAPPLNPITNWGEPNSGTWLWLWRMRFHQAYGVPGATPEQYIGYADLNDMQFEIQQMRKNSSGANQYLWFVWNTQAGISGPSLFMAASVRCLLATP